MGKNRGSNRLKTQIEPENDRRAGASAVVFHFPLKRLSLRQPPCGGVSLFPSEKVRISIWSAKDLASIPESRPESPADADVWGPKSHSVNQPRSPAALGSRRRISQTIITRKPWPSPPGQAAQLPPPFIGDAFAEHFLPALLDSRRQTG